MWSASYSVWENDLPLPPRLTSGVDDLNVVIIAIARKAHLITGLAFASARVDDLLTPYANAVCPVLVKALHYGSVVLTDRRRPRSSPA